MKPFRVEVTVDAGSGAVWRWLTEVEEIRQWFGWDYDGLDAEIRFIFVEHAVLVPPDRIELSADGTIELEDLGEQTTIRAVQPGEPDDGYDPIEEGWVTFLHQLRHRIARHAGARRRTIYLTGSADAAALELPGEPWHASRYQRGTDVDGTLVVVWGDGSDASLVVTTYDLDDDAFAAAEASWVQPPNLLWKRHWVHAVHHVTKM
jgi:hypothetical protein